MAPWRAKNYLKVVSCFLTANLIFCFLPGTLCHSQINPAFPQKGMCYASWERDEFTTSYSDKSLEKLASLGVDYISICVTQYQEKHNSPYIKRTYRTSSDRSLIHAIKKAQSMGLNTMLKPHIDLIDKHDGTYWRADIGFNNDKDWERWFAEYEKFITHYAEIAERLNVHIFCVGTELAFTAEKDDNWRAIISKVREIYSGKLVYAANWDNFQNIKFWQDLDYIGIDAYFPLANTFDPTIEDLKQGWQKWEKEIELFLEKAKKPVLFTEIGYPSANHASYEPWKNGFEGKLDIGLQEKCYRAFFETIWGKKWLAGVYWWSWDTSIYAGGKNNRHFTPQNKPAQKILERFYAK